MLIYRIIDILFVIFHTILILFNLSGWIWKKTRKLNLITLVITGVSWLFLGMLVGVPGYCPLTDWHFRVLEKLGKTDLPGSYIKYLADRITGINFNAVTVDRLTLYLFLGALFISLVLNVRDFSWKKNMGR
jgi:hypothetical protein